MRLSAFIGAVAALGWMTIATANAGAVVHVMVVGTDHMSNPNHNRHDVRSDDVLAVAAQGLGI